MGTNYYVVKQEGCPHCYKGEERRHIGKSSMGWCFSLRIYPEDGIESWDDWKRYLKGKVIFNEYAQAVEFNELIREVEERRYWGWETVKRYKQEEWFARNDAEKGPNGLARHKLDGRFCIGHGEGPYDYLQGDFS